MNDDSWAPYGAAAGAIAVALFLVGSVIIGTPPGFDSSGAEVANYLEEERTRIQLGSAIHAAWAPLFVWFLATVASLTRAGRPGTRRAGMVAFGCGLAFLALFLVDVTSLAVAALRPESMAAAPELAAALHDVSWLAMGMAAFLLSGLLTAFSVLALRDRALWPRWLGWLAALAGLAYALRVGTLFTTDGVFAADGVLGLWVPVIAVGSWLFAGSSVLALRVHSASEPGELVGRATG